LCWVEHDMGRGVFRRSPTASRFWSMAASSPPTCPWRSRQNEEVKRAYLGDQHVVTAPWLTAARLLDVESAIEDLLRP